MASKRIFLTGASGFVGSAVLDELLARGYAVNALIDRRDVTNPSVRCIKGGLFNPRAIDEGITGCDAVVHLVGIIMEKPSQGITFERIHFEGAKNVVDAAVRNGVRRDVHMSSLGVRPNAISTYHQTQYLASQYVRASGLDWTIFLPS